MPLVAFGRDKLSRRWMQHEPFFKKLSTLESSEWDTVTEFHFQSIWKLDDLANTRARKFMGLHFKKRYADIMTSQLALDLLTVQLDLEFPKSDILKLLKTLQVIPEATDPNTHLIPDLFESWKDLGPRTGDSAYRTFLYND